MEQSLWNMTSSIFIPLCFGDLGCYQRPLIQDYRGYFNDRTLTLSFSWKKKKSTLVSNYRVLKVDALYTLQMPKSPAIRCCLLLGRGDLYQIYQDLTAALGFSRPKENSIFQRPFGNNYSIKQGSPPWIIMVAFYLKAVTRNNVVNV